MTPEEVRLKTWEKWALIGSSTALIGTMALYFWLAHDPFRDLIRAITLFVGVTAMISCLTIVGLYIRRPHPMRWHIFAISASWVILAVSASLEVAQRWGEALTWRWGAALAAYVAGLWGFWFLSGSGWGKVDE